MGPDYGSEEYKEQVEQIVLALGNQGFTEEKLDGFLMMFILNHSYSRAAICEARKKILRGKTETSNSGT